MFVVKVDRGVNPNLFMCVCNTRTLNICDLRCKKLLNFAARTDSSIKIWKPLQA
jgi:hypothetical protein